MISDKFRKFLNSTSESGMSLREAKRICENAGYKVTEGSTKFIFDDPKTESIDIDAKNKVLTVTYRKNVFADFGDFDELLIGDVCWQVETKIMRMFDDLDEEYYYEYDNRRPKAKIIDFDIKEPYRYQFRKLSNIDLEISNAFENEDEVDIYFEKNVKKAFDKLKR